MNLLIWLLPSSPRPPALVSSQREASVWADLGSKVRPRLLWVQEQSFVGFIFHFLGVSNCGDVAYLVHPFTDVKE